ncbi:MAG: hypothetical protein ACREJD_16255 [Phycisphaerales bacterium]
MSSATLNSTLDPLYISFQLSAAVRPNGSAQYGTVSSIQTIEFSTPTNCSFGFAGTTFFGVASLSGPGVSMTPNPATPGYSYSGVFQAGQTYTLSVTTIAGPSQDRGISGTINITDITPAPQPAAFTYQGLLRSDGTTSISSPTDFRFTLYPASIGGAGIGSQITKSALPVSGGIFATTLDFGAVFSGTERWLEVEARNPAGTGDFIVMSPRTRLDSAPYSAYALAAKVGAVGGDLRGAGKRLGGVLSLAVGFGRPGLFGGHGERGRNHARAEPEHGDRAENWLGRHAGFRQYRRHARLRRQHRLHRVQASQSDDGRNKSIGTAAVPGR